MATFAILGWTHNIKDLAKIKNLQYSLYYSVYFETKEYNHLTTLSIAKAILSRYRDDYAATIVIDGLTKKDTEKVRKDLKRLQIRYDAIRGMKDELGKDTNSFLHQFLHQRRLTKVYNRALLWTIRAHF